jgi:hypothetical protein
MLLFHSADAERGARLSRWRRRETFRTRSSTKTGIVMGPAPVRLSPRKLARGLIAKRAVRTTLVIFDTPAYQDNARFVQIAEEFAVQAFIRSLS